MRVHFVEGYFWQPWPVHKIQYVWLQLSFSLQRKSLSTVCAFCTPAFCIQECGGGEISFRSWPHPITDTGWRKDTYVPTVLKVLSIELRSFALGCSWSVLLLYESWKRYGVNSSSIYRCNGLFMCLNYTHIFCSAYIFCYWIEHCAIKNAAIFI